MSEYCKKCYRFLFGPADMKGKKYEMSDMPFICEKCLKVKRVVDCVVPKRARMAK